MTFADHYATKERWAALLSAKWGMGANATADHAGKYTYSLKEGN